MNAHPSWVQVTFSGQAADQASGSREVYVDDATAVFAGKVMMGIHVAVVT
jgi:hypothetical protein